MTHTYKANVYGKTLFTGSDTQFDEAKRKGLTGKVSDVGIDNLKVGSILFSYDENKGNPYYHVGVCIGNHTHNGITYEHGVIDIGGFGQEVRFRNLDKAIGGQLEYYAELAYIDYETGAWDTIW